MSSFTSAISITNVTIQTENFSKKYEYRVSFTTWITYEIISVSLSLIALYLCTVLIYYSYLKSSRSLKKLRRQASAGSRTARENNSSSFGVERNGSVTSVEGHERRRSDGTGKAAKPLRILCLLAAVFALARVAGDQLELATYGQERINCKTYQIFIVSTYALSATCIYSALWVRLRIFFNHPIMHHLASRFLDFFIWCALACVLGSAILNTSIFIITVQAVDSSLGCINGQTTSISPDVRYVILTLSTVVSQTLLLSLFLYPIIKHRSSMRTPIPPSPYRVTSKTNGSVRQFPKSPAHQSDTEMANGEAKPVNVEVNPLRKSKRYNREKRLIIIIRRVLITASICVISDVLAAVITIAFNDQPRVVTNMVFSLNLLVNLISVLRSFGDWQERLIPCCAKPREKASKSKTISVLGMSRWSPKELPVSPSRNAVHDNWRPCHDSSGSGSGEVQDNKKESPTVNHQSFHGNSNNYNGLPNGYKTTTA